MAPTADTAGSNPSDSDDSSDESLRVAPRRRCRFPLYAQVLVAIVAGIAFGGLLPAAAQNPWVKAMGTGFVKLIKMVIAPIIFCTIVSGISHARDAAKIGRVALKALLYFECVSTLALGVGLGVANLVGPGRGFRAAPEEPAVQRYTTQAANHSSRDFVLHIIPDTAVGAFADGDILQVLFFSVLFGFAMMRLGDRADGVQKLIDDVANIMFGVISIIMKAAPIGAFGAMAFTVGKYGVSSLGSLLAAVLVFYLTAACFVCVVLGSIAACARFNLFRLLNYIRSELLIVISTASSEAAMPSLLAKLENLGCSKPVVGLVVPLGYSFNLDGTNIYMTLATVFISQAMGVDLSFAEQFKILVVAMLTSKGAAAVSGGGFITLASTLHAVRPELVPGIAIMLGIDKFMAECRSLTNFIGNAVAAIVVAASEGDLDREVLSRALAVGACEGGDQEDELM